MQQNQKRAAAVGGAIAAGLIAAGVAYLFYVRPQWRRQVVEVGRHVLNLAEGVVKRQLK